MGGLALVFACTTYADRDRREPTTAERGARSLVTAYLAAESKDDFNSMERLFCADAYLEYTYEWGYGHDDSTYVFDFSKAKKPDLSFEDEAYHRFVEDYHRLGRETEIARPITRKDGSIVVKARVLEKYDYRGVVGTSTATLTILVEGSRSQQRIKRLVSTTKF